MKPRNHHNGYDANNNNRDDEEGMTPPLPPPPRVGPRTPPEPEDGGDLYNYDDPSDDESEGSPPPPLMKNRRVKSEDEEADSEEEYQRSRNYRRSNRSSDESDEDGEVRSPPVKKEPSSPGYKSKSTSSKGPAKHSKSDHKSSSSTSKELKQHSSSKSSSSHSSSGSRKSPSATKESSSGKISFLPKKYEDGGGSTSSYGRGSGGGGRDQDESDRSYSRRSRRDSSSSTGGGDDEDPDYDAEYFKRMASRSKDSFHDPTDKELFIENIWKHIKGKELALCSHKHSTDCIIWFVENVRDNSILRKVTDNMSVDRLNADLLKDESVSAVMESLVEALIRVLVEEEEKEFDTSTARWIIKYLDGLAKLIQDNATRLLIDSINGCRIVIVMIEAIGGIRIGRHWSRQNMRFGSGVRVNLQSEIEKDISFKDLPSPFKHHLKRFAKCLVLESNDSDIREILFGRATQVAQYLLFILKVRYPELCQMVVKKLVEVVFDRRMEDRDTICQSASSAYIVEIIMMVASETRLSKIWTKYLKGSLENLWRHDIANFIVQRLIDAIKEEKLFADVCAEIFPDLDEIFKCNRAGIGVCLAKACQDFQKMQHEFVAALLKAYSCYEPKEKQLDLVPSMLFIEMKMPPPFANKWNNNNNFNNNNHHNNSSPGFSGGPKIQIWLHGSLMLQYMMAFNDPHKVSKSLLSLSTSDIVKIARDRSGSHVIDAFIHGDNVPLKHKSELVERFLGHYHYLSLDKFGSRIVENIITLSDNQVKRAIMDELSQHEAQLTSNRNGWFVARKVGLHTFKHRPGDWREMEQKHERKKRTFSEFLAGPLGPNRGQGPTGAGATPGSVGFGAGGGMGPGFKRRF